MTTKIWILLANATKANIFEISEPHRQFHLLQKLSHETSRLKNIDLKSDKPGHYHKSSDSLKGSYEAKTDPKAIEIQHFAKIISDVLEKERKQTPPAYQSLIVIAEPHFYGILNQQFPTHVRHLVKYHLPKDYTHYSEKKLTKALESTLAHEINLLLTA